MNDFEWEARMDDINLVLEAMFMPEGSLRRQRYDPNGIVKGQVPDDKIWDYHQELITTPNEESIRSELIAKINEDIANGKYDEFLKDCR